MTTTEYVELHAELRKMWKEAGCPKDLTEFVKDQKVRRIVDTLSIERIRRRLKSNRKAREA